MYKDDCGVISDNYRYALKCDKELKPNFTLVLQINTVYLQFDVQKLFMCDYMGLCTFLFTADSEKKVGVDRCLSPLVLKAQTVAFDYSSQGLIGFSHNYTFPGTEEKTKKKKPHSILSSEQKRILFYIVLVGAVLIPLA